MGCLNNTKKNGKIDNFSLKFFDFCSKRLNFTSNLYNMGY